MGTAISNIDSAIAKLKSARSKVSVFKSMSYLFLQDTSNSVSVLKERAQNIIDEINTEIDRLDACKNKLSVNDKGWEDA